MVVGLFAASDRLDHTMTHMRKCSEGDRERQTGSIVFLPGFFASLWVGSHDLCYKISHCLRRSALLLPDGVSVGTKGKSGVVVANILLTVFTSTPFWSGRVVRVCLRLWNLTGSRPASVRIFSWSFSPDGTFPWLPARGTCTGYRDV